MLIAYDKDKNRIHVEEYIRHSFPIYCMQSHELVLVRGEIKKPHFRHKATNIDCAYSGGKSDFHLWWQSRVKKDYLEVRMQRDNILHIADIVNTKSVVIEIQHSIMDKETIKKREDFYGNMIWIFDISNHFTDIKAKFKDLIVLNIQKGNMYFVDAQKKYYLDKGYQGVFEVLRRKKSLFLCRKIPLTQFDDIYFKDIVTDDRDMRLDKPYFDVSQKATDYEIKNYKL